MCDALEPMSSEPTQDNDNRRANPTRDPAPAQTQPTTRAQRKPGPTNRTIDDTLTERKPAKPPKSLIARQSTTTIPARAETWHGEPGATQARPLPTRTKTGPNGPGPSENTGESALLADWPGDTPDQRNRVAMTGSAAAQPPHNRTISLDHPLGGGFEDTTTAKAVPRRPADCHSRPVVPSRSEFML